MSLVPAFRRAEGLGSLLVWSQPDQQRMRIQLCIPTWQLTMPYSSLCGHQTYMQLTHEFKKKLISLKIVRSSSKPCIYLWGQGKEHHDQGWTTLLLLMPRSGVLSRPMPTSLLFMRCWSRWKKWSCWIITTGSPWLWAIVGNLRGGDESPVLTV